MTPDDRLNKRIKIAARMIAAVLIGGHKLSGIDNNDKQAISRWGLSVADAIIDTAIGDMTAEPTCKS
jgi:hypothetical protein